jgi:HlyD family secretion protein
MRVRSSTIVLIFVVVVLAAIIVWGVSRKAAPPEVPFARTSRETIVSTIPTNGKVEPIEWATARAGRAGAVQKIFVHRGQTVRAGDPLVALDTSQVAASVAAAGARVKEAQAQQTVIREGGRAADVAEIDGSLARAQLDLETAQRDSDALQRLEARQAATRKEVQDAQERVKQAQLQIQSLQRRRAALVTQPDRTAAEARVHEAQASEEIARNNLALSVVRAPVPGTVYQFDLTLGAFLQVGDLVANIGRLDRVRVKVYVDEPDLGRMGIGMPVTITWDALPGRRWKGVVDRLPTEVAPLGTRQVGEVGCAIDNPDHDLVPGTNVNAEIQSKVVENALTAPREALRRQDGVGGVLALGNDNVLEWRPIQMGVTSAGRVQVTSGLKAGDAVALPTEKTIKAGMKVTPVYP